MAATAASGLLSFCCLYCRSPLPRSFVLPLRLPCRLTALFRASLHPTCPPALPAAGPRHVPPAGAAGCPAAERPVLLVPVLPDGPAPRPLHGALLPWHEPLPSLLTLPSLCPAGCCSMHPCRTDPRCSYVAAGPAAAPVFRCAWSALPPPAAGCTVYPRTAVPLCSGALLWPKH